MKLRAGHLAELTERALVVPGLPRRVVAWDGIEAIDVRRVRFGPDDVVIRGGAIPVVHDTQVSPVADEAMVTWLIAAVDNHRAGDRLDSGGRSDGTEEGPHGLWIVPEIERDGERVHAPPVGRSEPTFRSRVPGILNSPGVRADKGIMEHSWIIVVLVATSPFLVAAAVWGGITLFHRYADGRSIVESFGPVVVPDRRGRTRFILGALATAGAVVSLVGSMSVLAAGVLCLGAVGATMLVVHHGAVEPAIDPIAFDEAWRSFLDDAA